MSRFNRLSVLASALLLIAFGIASGAVAQPLAVGFQSLLMPDPEGSPVEIGVWYPTHAAPSPHPLELFTQTVAKDGPVAGEHLPLVVISHGNGGTLGGHYDAALALARAGFVVAALQHTGDNYKDQRLATDVANRPRQLHLLIDYMLNVWPSHQRIDPGEVGAFGFSSGGFTVLVAAGGEPDLTLVGPHCRDHPQFFDCQLLRGHPRDLKAASAEVFVHDSRLKAIVVAAPALGYAFAPDGLKGVTAAVDLWRDGDDHILPHPFYAEVVRTSLPTPPTYHVVPHMDHFDFLAPCTAALATVAPFICKSEPGFDRAAFHTQFDTEVVAFFQAHLKP